VFIITGDDDDGDGDGDADDTGLGRCSSLTTFVRKLGLANSSRNIWPHFILASVQSRLLAPTVFYHVQKSKQTSA
jgi:hypothetical protein